MKKYLAIIVMAAAFALPSQAQIRFGVKGGLNLTTLTTSNDDLEKGITNKSGFFIGPTVKFTLPIVSLGVDASVLYDQREGRIKATDERLKQKSIQIPINFRAGFGLGDLANVFAFLGPQFGFNVGGDTENNKITDWSLKTACISGNIGLGIMLANHFQLTGNYNICFTNSAKFKIFKDGYSLQNYDYVNVKNHAWQIALAYYF